MGTMVQLNTRISPQLKQQGDVVFASAGLTSSEVVRAIWTYAATHQEVPDFLLSHLQDEEAEQLLRAIHNGAGIAHRLGKSMGYEVSENPASYHDMRDEMYDELIVRMEQNHA